MTEPDRIWINDKWEAYLRPTFAGDTSGYVRADIAALPARGVKPPFYFDRYINGVRMAEDVCIERETTLEGAMQAAARIAAKGPNGEAPVLVYRAPAAQAREAAIRDFVLREALAAVNKAREAVIHSGNRAYIDGISVGHDRAEIAILALIGEART